MSKVKRPKDVAEAYRVMVLMQKEIEELRGVLWELMKEHEVPMGDYYKELLK